MPAGYWSGLIVYKMYAAVLYFIFFCNYANAENQPILFSKDSRVLVIAPHPDDETLGAGGIIQSALGAGGDVKVIYLTHGDYNEIASLFFQKKPLLSTSDFIRSGQNRKKEAVNAMSVLHLEEKNLVFFGYPDFGTLKIWRRHWGETKPFRSFFTRINKVPYKEDFSYGRPYRGDNIVNDFEKIFLSYQPTHVFVTAPQDLNPDHRAAYLYTEVALLNLQDKITRPQVFTYLVHVHHWPEPRKYIPDEALKPPVSIEDQESLHWTIYRLSRDQVELKKKALLEYASQMAYSKDFMLSFARANELYSRLPYVDLNVHEDNQKPNSGKTAKEDTSNKVNYWVQNRELWVDVRVTSPLDELGILHMEIFSYKHGMDFSKCPKLSLGLLGRHVWAKDGRVALSGIQYDLKKKTLLIRIPLELLKSPDYLFVSAQTIKDDVSLDFGAWKILKVPAIPSV